MKKPSAQGLRARFFVSVARKIVCSAGGVWLEPGTGICDAQEIAEREAATLEGTARPKVDAQLQSAQLPVGEPPQSDGSLLGGPGSGNLPVGTGCTTDLMIMMYDGQTFGRGCQAGKVWRQWCLDGRMKDGPEAPETFCGL